MACYMSVKENTNFFQHIRNRSYKRSIHALGNAIIRAYANEWLVLEDYDSTDCYLWNPISNQKIPLPPLPYNDNDKLKCLSSAPPHDPECRVLFLIHETTTPDDDDDDNNTDEDENSDENAANDDTDTNDNDTDNENPDDDDDANDTDPDDDDTDPNDEDTDDDNPDDDANDDETPPAIYFCKPGYDEEFHKQDLKSIVGDNHFSGWTVFKGDFYVLTWQTRILLRLDVDDSSGTITATPMTNQRPYDYFIEFLDMPFFGSHLIQSSSEVLYVHKLLYGRKCQEVYKITVFRFDFVKKVWEEMKSIGFLWRNNLFYERHKS